MNKWLTTTALMCALAMAGSLAAQGGTGTTGKPATERQGASKGQADKPQSPNADAQFMQTAAMDSMAEVVHGKQAATNAQSDEVKKFAQRMVDDHSKANDELKGLASQKQVTLPTELDQKHQAMQQKLEKTKGADFDRAYMQHMVQAHKQAVTLFQREAKTGKDAETRAWAEKTLPVLQEHLKMATEISGKVAKGGK
jgi:putative membrane protein